jgi:hypothetical protein
VIARTIVPAEKLVEIADVARQAPADGAAQQLQRPEAGRPYAVVIDRDLVVVAEIERLEQPPDVGLVELGRAVAGAIGQQHDIAPRGACCPVGPVSIDCRRSLGCTACPGHVSPHG